jgi:hypothetical protein
MRLDYLTWDFRRDIHQDLNRLRSERVKADTSANARLTSSGRDRTAKRELIT